MYSKRSKILRIGDCGLFNYCTKSEIVNPKSSIRNPKSTLNILNLA
jgi:hypothetical protein